MRQQTRSHITHSARQADPIAARRHRCGWKACVTNAGPQRRSLRDAAVGYRNAYRVERLVHRLQSRVQIAPLLIKRNEHMAGLTSRLTLGVRV